MSLFFLYVITRYFLKNFELIKKASNYLLFSTLAATIIVVTMGWSVRGDESSRISGGIGDPNEFASYILVLLPLAYYHASSSIGLLRVFYWLILTNCSILLLYTNSRGGMIGLLGIIFVMIYYYGYKRFKQIILFLLVFALILMVLTPNNFWFRMSTIVQPEKEKEIHSEAISARINNYSAALKLFIEYPLFGVGLYNFQFYNLNYGAIKSTVAHNTYLEILTGGGLASFIPFLLILLDCWQKLKIRNAYHKNITNFLICLKASFVSILLTSFFISADHKKILWFLLAFVSSVYYIATSHVANEKRKQSKCN